MGRIFGYEPAIANAIVKSLGSARALFELDSKSLNQVISPFSKFRGLITKSELERSADELSRLHSQGVVYVDASQDAYPKLLKECDDAPQGLYLRSCSAPEDIFNQRPQIAIVGTRDISPYGREWCMRMVEAIAECKEKPLIVSGLAIGTDIEAHLAALDRGLPTIGVMATGIDSIYPARHSRHAQKMVATPGCGLVTDYPPGTTPLTVNFLRRNRIIAGMCSAVILVESKVKGGGMMTSKLAFSYGRNVFALPGRIDDVRSGGCNNLIHEMIAEPIEDLGSLVKALGLGEWNRRSKDSLLDEIGSKYGSQMPEDSLRLFQSIASAIQKNRGISVDEIAGMMNLPYQTVSYITATLESDGFIYTDLLQRCGINFKKV